MTMGLSDLTLRELELRVLERCGGNPLDGEWEKLYGDLLRVIRQVGNGLSPGSKVHRLIVAAAAVHYMRYEFQSAGSFWGGFCEAAGVNRGPLVSVIDAWLVGQGVEVIKKSGRRLVVQTLLSVTGVPVRWNREFADFFQWFWQQEETLSAQDAWERYPAAKGLSELQPSFCQSADRLRRAFGFLLDQDLTWDADPAQLCQLVVGGLGSEYDPRRLVRRTSSFEKLWRELFDRLTIGQFRRWLRAHPEEWVTTPTGRREPARKLFVRDDVSYGIYRRENGASLEILPSQRVSLRQVCEEWPLDRIWSYGNLAGYKSHREFRVTRNGSPYGRSLPAVANGRQFHLYLAEVPLGGTLSINGQHIPGRSGLEWGGLAFWLDRQEETYSFGLEIGQFTIALPQEPSAPLVISVENGERVYATYRTTLDRMGELERTDTRLVVAAPAPGDVTCRLEAGKSRVSRAIVLPPVMLFTGGGEWVPPRERSVPFGGKYYTLLVADGEPDPTFDPDSVEVEWTSVRCGEYRIGKVKWRNGVFRLVAGSLRWQFERCLTVALALLRSAPLPQLESVTVEWPGNVYERFDDFKVHLISSLKAHPGALSLHLFRQHTPVARIRLEPNDRKLKRVEQQECWWEINQESLIALRDEANVPGAYELILKADEQVLSRYRFFLIPPVRMKGGLQPQAEGTVGAVTLVTPGPALLAPGGVAERNVSLSVPFRVHEVAHGQDEIHCHPEPVRTAVTCIHPQITLPVVVTPTVCGYRAFRINEGTVRKTGIVEYEDLDSTRLFVFGPPGTQVEVCVGKPVFRRLLRLQLNDLGEGQFESLANLAPCCIHPLNQFTVKFAAGPVVTLQVRWAPRVRKVTLPHSFGRDSSVACKPELSAPGETKLEVVLVSKGYRVGAPFTEKVLPNRWRRITAQVPVVELLGHSKWYVLLLVNGQQQVLGEVWNEETAEGGIGTRPPVPLTELADQALEHLRTWGGQRRPLPLVLWAPIPGVREQLLRLAHTTLRGAEILWPLNSKGHPTLGDFVTPDPLTMALAGGVALGGKIGVAEALELLRRRDLPPVIVPDAHTLSVYERLVLRTMSRKICLISATAIPVEELR